MTEKPPAGAEGGLGSDRSIAWALFATLVPGYLLMCGGHFTASDDVQKYGALKAMVLERTVFFPDGWVSGVGGGCSFYPLGGSLLMAPGALLGWVTNPWLPLGSPDVAARFFISLQNAWFTAALVALLFYFGRVLGCARGPSLVAALALGFGTMVWPYAKTCWSEPATALAALGATALIVRASWEGLRPRGALLGAGCLVAMAALVRLETLLLVPGAVAWLFWRHRAEPARLASALGWAAWPVGVAMALALAYNQARFGSPWHFSNWHTVQDATVMPPGGRLAWALNNLWHYTANPSDGPLWFSPALLLGLLGWPRLWRARPEVGRLVALTTLPLFLFYVAAWGLSDWAWGLRYTYVFHPFVLLGACGLAWSAGWRRVVLGGILAAGVGVQVLAVPHNFGYLFERERAAYPGLTIQAMMADPRHTPLLMAWRDWPETLKGVADLVDAPRPAEMPEMAEVRLRSQFVPDFWPVLLLLTPVPRLYVLLGTLVLLAATALGLRRLRRSWRATIMEGGQADGPPAGGTHGEREAHRNLRHRL